MLKVIGTMRYGIGITTRNRPSVLEAALSQHLKFVPSDCKFVIVDDNSDTDNYSVVSSFVEKTNAEFRYSPKRLGIAKAKNACLTRLTDCDHIFLFDDDAWPRMEGWADSWAWAADYEGVGHSMFMSTLSKDKKNNKKSDAVMSVIDHTEYFTSWNNCFGVVLHFSKKCIQTIGGYDHARAINVYGYEHAQMSKRAMMAGFTKKHNYLSPSNCLDLVYSLDINYCWHGELPPFDCPWIHTLKSSTTVEEANAHSHNAQMMNIKDPYIPLVDPLE